LRLRVEGGLDEKPSVRQANASALAQDAGSAGAPKG
jgi:hypothetical protein